MPMDGTEDEKSRKGQTGAAKTPRSPDNAGEKTKAAEREARLSQALRENLRRRKAGAQNRDEEMKED